MITKEAPRDVIDVLLNDTSGQLTYDLIADNIIDMMIPGEDSVPVLLTLAVKYLSDFPAVLQQLLVCGNYGSCLFLKSLAVCMAHDSGILR
ncbi:cytochrome P450 90D2-like [Humulus lupulus]|uniref:cytochrome P450 90D2-like n=1 Tax=Humulus lupulus TaxID=3486 RepID=UPI002B41570D|nr:cytochrome P450 90D2-like [Humulus lupulus]XP_062093079.1 cytochrome P450 90D2-like [Humulus lupulus]XP_062093080.1 cytochrome P450 90D2-like [Humulus lupulus]